MSSTLYKQKTDVVFRPQHVCIHVCRVASQQRMKEVVEENDSFGPAITDTWQDAQLCSDCGCAMATALKHEAVGGVTSVLKTSVAQ